MPHLSRSSGLLQLAWIAIAAIVAGPPPPTRADDFSRLIGPSLFDIPGRPDAKGLARLSLRAIEALPEVVHGERSALILVTTDEGNLAKLLVSPALRLGATGGSTKGDRVPVLSLDRFETIDRGDRVARKARGRDVVLFDGFAFDLDTGQVVPPGFGGDITFAANGNEGADIRAIGESRLYPIDRPVKLPGTEPGRPSSGRTVLPTDFNGRYTLISNGQLSGALELSIAADGTVSGRFRSDRNGGLYPVAGKVAPDLSRRIEFEIKFPRSRQSFDGLLWTEEKNVFAGTSKLLEHPYSFLAVREGAPIYPEPIDATTPPRPPSVLKTITRVVTVEGDRYGLDGVEQTADELTTALSATVKSRDPAEVLIRVPPSTSLEKVQQLIRIVRGAGIEVIRFGTAGSP